MFLLADLVRLCLLFCLLGMFLMAALYLGRRQLTWWEVLAWGLIALLIPILGPFLTILSRPGTPRRKAHPADLRA